MSNDPIYSNRNTTESPKRVKKDKEKEKVKKDKEGEKVKEAEKAKADKEKAERENAEAEKAKKEKAENEKAGKDSVKDTVNLEAETKGDGVAKMQSWVWQAFKDLIKESMY